VKIRGFIDWIVTVEKYRTFLGLSYSPNLLAIKEALSTGLKIGFVATPC